MQLALNILLKEDPLNILYITLTRCEKSTMRQYFIYYFKKEMSYFITFHFLFAKFLVLKAERLFTV
jgi:hypothetical protein